MTHLKVRLCVFSLMTLCFLLSSCNSQQNSSNQAQSLATTSPSKLNTVSISSPTNVIELENRWIKGIPCSPPCWEGITPGNTSINEAIQILKNNLPVSDVSNNTNQKILTWLWNKDKINIYDEGKITYSDNQMVSDIYPGFGQTSFLLGDVVKIYGMPNYIVARAGQNIEGGGLYYFSAIIFSDKGFAAQLNGRVANSSLLPKIDENTKVTYGVKFFLPGQTSATKIYNTSTNGLKSWQNYNSFDYYCQPIDMSQIKNCKDIPTY